MIEQLEPPTQGQSLEDTQQVMPSPGHAKTHDNIFSQMPTLQILQQKINELEARRDALFPPRKEAASADPMNEHDIVVCQCGWNEEEDDMVCSTSNHLADLS